MNESVYIAGADDAGMRIDAFVAKQDEGLTRSAVQRLIESGNVLCNDIIPTKNTKLKENDTIRVSIPDPEPEDALPENIPLEIPYEDDDLLVVNKPKGMVVHPSAGHSSKTLVNALLYHCGDSLSGIGGVARPGIVHRIDKDTSGLLIVAKNDFAHLNLAGQIKEHSFTRKYQAVVYGNFKDDEGVVDLPIGRHPTDRKKMAVTSRNSREALTRYRVLGRYRGFTHLELTLETGRTHQIRVHMAHLGHPVAGDPVYGPKKVITSLAGQCLHAYFISFVHPRSGETITLESDLPQYFTDFLKTLDS